jgi:hypothetical protein
MRTRFLIGLTILALAGCGTPTPHDGSPYYTQRSGVGETIVSIVGTPLLIAPKIPACVVTVAASAPAAGAAGLGSYEAGKQATEVLGEGVAQTCGPPYVLSP